MIKSMTAFARSSAQSTELEISWELKTVNQRYLDITMRLPDALRHLEMKSRELLQQRLGRGKLEAICRYRLLSQSSSGMPLDNEKVSAVITACNEIEMQMGGIGTALNALDVLGFPGVIAEQDGLITDDGLVLKVLADCIDELEQSRQAEGQRMKALIQNRAEAMQNIVAEVRTRRPEVIAAVQNKLKERIKGLLEKAENDRLEQELVMIAQKMDIDEELDRIDSHLQELNDIFKRTEPVGRRLDFLMQEFNREANTLGAKSADIKTTQAAIELKVLIEQMREQVQNIE